MKNRTTSIPEPAVRLNGLLENRYDSEHPFILDTPCHVVKRILNRNYQSPQDLNVISCWPSAGSVTIRDTRGIVSHIFDYMSAGLDQDGLEWSRSDLGNLEEQVRKQLRGQYARTLLAEAVPVGRLQLPEDTTVLLTESDGTRAPYILEAVWTEDGKPYVRYGDSASRFENPAGDLSEEDILGILAAIGKPAGTGKAVPAGKN